MRRSQQPKERRRENPPSPTGPVSLPHSQESERAVLAAILLSPAEVLPLVTGRLVAEDLYLERHQLIFRSMLELQESGAGVDLRTLQADLEQRGAFEKVGGLAYLAALDMDLPDLARVSSYVEIVKETSVRRRMIREMSGIVQGCTYNGTKAAEALEQAERLVLDLGTEAVARDVRPLGDVYEETVAALEEKTGGMIGLPSGFYDWDRMSQGLIAGNLIICAGRPGMGKTSFALNVAQHIAIREGKTAVIFSLEMSALELAQRVMSSESDLPFSSLRAGRLTQNQWSKLFETLRRTRDAPLYIDDSPNPSLLEIAAKSRRLKSEKGLALVVVDYLQLMSSGERFQNRQLELASISRGLKQLAKEVEAPVMALSQLSRNPENRGEHRPQLSDLRDSGAIEQDADLVAFLYRDEVYHKDDPDSKGLAELIVAKHRNGATGTVELVFLGEVVTFRNFGRQEEPARTTYENERIPF